MRLITRFKLLSFWNKIGVLGALASIIALGISIAVLIVPPGNDSAGRSAQVVSSGGVSPQILVQNSPGTKINIPGQNTETSEQLVASETDDAETNTVYSEPSATSLSECSRNSSIDANCGATLCKAREARSTSVEALAPRLRELLRYSSGRKAALEFLDSFPELIGWRFSWGSTSTLVRPKFRLGNEFIVDFLVLDAPQWVDVYLVAIESPFSNAFQKDGNYSRALSDAISRTVRWQQWVADNKPYMRSMLSKMIEKVITPGENERYGRYDFSPFLRRAIDGGYWRLKTAIVIGRRSSFGGKEERNRIGLMESTNQAALFSFDAILDICQDR